MMIKGIFLKKKKKKKKKMPQILADGGVLLTPSEAVELETRFAQQADRIAALEQEVQRLMVEGRMEVGAIAQEAAQVSQAIQAMSAQNETLRRTLADREQFMLAQMRENVTLSLPQEIRSAAMSSPTMETWQEAPRGSMQFNAVASRIASIPALDKASVRVYELANVALFLKFAACRVVMTEVEKCTGFLEGVSHGTSLGVARSIAKNGFDVRFSTNGLLGKGIYFAELPIYANWFAAERTKSGSTDDESTRAIIFSDVLTGLCTERSTPMGKDEKIPEGVKSVRLVGRDTRRIPIVAIYENCRALPRFVVTYRTTPGAFCPDPDDLLFVREACATNVSRKSLTQGGCISKPNRGWKPDMSVCGGRDPANLVTRAQSAMEK
jgi:hypothetical protein